MRDPCFDLIAPGLVGWRWLPATSARAAEPSAAGLWQKIEKGKTVGMFLVRRP